MSNSRKQHSRSSGRKTRKNRFQRRRWLLLPLALLFALAALYVLASLAPEGPLAPGSPPPDDIDDASRLRLERVLLEADRAEEGAR